MSKDEKKAKADEAALKPLRLLIVEDSQNDADLVLRELKRGGFDVKWKRVQTAADMESAVSTESWDIIISDFKMPNFTGLEALQILKKKELDTPFIIASGTIGEETAVSIMKAGASDYLMKDNLARLPAAVERELRDAANRREKREADKELRISNERLSLAQRAAKSGLWNWDISSGKLYWSDEFYELFGLPCGSEASFEVWKKILHPDDIQKAMDHINRSVAENIDLANEYRIILPDGTIKWIGATGSVSYDGAGNPASMSGICIDITERKKSEDSIKKSSEEIYDLYNNAPCGYHSLDKDGFFIQINDTELKWLGYTREELIGRKKFTYVILQEDIAVFNKTFPMLKKRGFINNIEGNLVRKDGSVFPVVINATTVNDEKGNFLYSRSSVFDNSERRLAEKMIKESEFFLKESQRIAHLGSWRWEIGADRIQWTDETYRIYGVKQESFMPTVEGLLGLIYPDDRPGMKEWLRACAAGEHPAEKEFRTVLPDGSIRILNGRGDLQYANDGAPLRMMGTVQDITERKKLEESLETALQAAEMGRWDLDLINEKATRSLRHDQIFGYRELLPKWNYEIFMSHVLPEDHDYVAGCFKKAFETGYLQFECRIKWQDGSMHWIGGKGKVYRDPSGKPNRMAGVVVDITENKLLEERIRQSEKMEAIGQLAGGIAHDFNNQLAGIMGYSEMLVERLDDKNLREYAEDILRASKRAADLTKNMLAFSRKGKYLSVPVNVHKVIEETISILNHSIDKKIELKRSLAANPAMISGDPTQLQNVLLNLALNARDAIKGTGSILFCTENAEKDKIIDNEELANIIDIPYMKISVSDTGCGMDEETIKHIFEPFYTTKEPGKGTGMGLASVYGTVKTHNGIIKVQSQPGKGSIFSIYFPILLNVADNEDVKTDMVGAVTAARILLVDDEKMVADMVAAMLRTFGHKIIVSNDSEEAISIYRKSYKDIDLVIMDMVMPKMSGKEVFVSMKEINPQVKAILSSGYSIDGDAQSILDAGAKAFIQKPFIMKELNKLINDVVTGR